VIDPGIALGAFALLLGVTGLLFWPRRGLVPQLLRWRRAGARVSMEDALKHLYKMERSGGSPSMASLAGAVGVGQQGAAKVLELLHGAGLVTDERPLQLTDEGRRYALRIIRTHRLWERFLADRTGVNPDDWHEAAEEREHYLSEADADRLAARLGHPRYDPHGDPIPTASGEIPPPTGVPLTHLGPGERGKVTHLEDEPASLYQRLLAVGLSPGLSITVVSREGSRVRVHADDRDFELDALAAENVTVTRAGGEHAVAAAPTPGGTVATTLTLAELRHGEVAEVVGLAPICQGIQRRRLLDLGVVPGTRVTAELTSLGGDPVAYLIRGALIALRGEQQRWIRIRRVDEAEAA
jgi:DtxR family Mn-dependent transcriptional regulator